MINLLWFINMKHWVLGHPTSTVVYGELFTSGLIGAYLRPNYEHD